MFLQCFLRIKKNVCSTKLNKDSGGRQEWVIAGGRVYEGDKCRWENTIKNVCSLYNDEQFSQSKF